MRLVRVRVLRPIAIFGRVAASRELLRLDVRDAEPLIASGHVEVIDDVYLVEANGSGKWVDPMQR